MNNSITISPETIAELIESQYADMIEVAHTVGVDKAEWKPLEKGRTVLSQLQECAVRADRMVATLNGNVFTAFATSEENAVYSTFEKAIEGCTKNAANLAAKLRTLSDDDLLKVVQTPSGEFSLARLMIGTYWNACYHEGQIYYISSLLAE